MLGDGLVFAGGAPRSGLTLLRALANSHPDIAAGPDTNICAPLCAQYNDFATNLGALHRDHFDLPPKTVQQNFAEYIAALFGNAKQPGRTRRVLEKSALNVLAFEQLHAMLPGARFIHMVRGRPRCRRFIIEPGLASMARSCFGRALRLCERRQRRRELLGRSCGCWL